eukprot:SAG31_NODE_26630_length_439_cov_0.758824_1_plen_109_part_00
MVLHCPKANATWGFEKILQGGADMVNLDEANLFLQLQAQYHKIQPPVARPKTSPEIAAARWWQKLKVDPNFVPDALDRGGNGGRPVWRVAGPRARLQDHRCPTCYALK